MTLIGRKSLAVIVNPAAGGGRARRVWHRAERFLRHADCRFEASFTEGRGHATALSREAVERGFSTVVAVGGDGTVHEVVNGWALDAPARGDTRLGLIPAGTGVDFQRNMRRSASLRSALQDVLSDDDVRIDLGLAGVSGRHAFVNFAEVGLGAAVVAREARFGAAWPGRASFLLAAVEAATSENNLQVEIFVDGAGGWSGAVTSVIVANGPYFGGGMKIAPPASMLDGQFDLIVLGDFTRLERITQIWKIYPGLHLRHQKVEWRRVEHMRVETRERAYMDLDGELYDSEEYEFRVIPGALRVAGTSRDLTGA